MKNFSAACDLPGPHGIEEHDGFVRMYGPNYEWIVSREAIEAMANQPKVDWNKPQTTLYGLPVTFQDRL